MEINRENKRRASIVDKFDDFEEIKGNIAQKGKINVAKIYVKWLDIKKV